MVLQGVVSRLAGCGFKDIMGVVLQGVVLKIYKGCGPGSYRW